MFSMTKGSYQDSTHKAKTLAILDARYVIVVLDFDISSANPNAGYSPTSKQKVETPNEASSLIMFN